VLTVLGLGNFVREVILGGSYTHAVTWMSGIIYLLHFIVSILLVIGIKQEKVQFIMINVWVSIVDIALLLINAVMIFVLGLTWPIFVVSLIYLIVLGYCVVVVRSYAISIGVGAVSPA
ncbi:unnamed protein product, partial [Meganyctiphanes norvegica]